MLTSTRTLLGLGLLLLGASAVTAGSDRPLKHSPYDPHAATVKLFEGLKCGAISVKVVPNGAKGGSLFLTNQTQEPLTVQMPQSFVGVPVKAQFGTFGAGQGTSQFGQNSGIGNGAGNNMGAAAGTQAIGGSTGSNLSGATGTGINGSSSSNPFPQGFFSIPADKTLRVPYTSVCLNHGLNEPTSRAHMELMAVEDYTSDPVLQALINQIGSGEQHVRTLQAAVWHVANGISWQELAGKGTSPIRVPGDNYFSTAQMQAAQAIVNEIQTAHLRSIRSQTASAVRSATIELEPARAGKNSFN